MKFVVLLYALACSTPAIGAEKFKLLVVHADGDVRISEAMSYHDCEFARNRVLGLPATAEEKEAARQANVERDRADQKALDEAPLCKIGASGRPVLTYEYNRCAFVIADGHRRWGAYVVGGGGGSSGFSSMSSSVSIKVAECFR